MGAGLTVKRLARRSPLPQRGIVHLGPGAFFRAFNAVYTEEAMAAEGGNWGIAAVGLRSRTAYDQLAPQGGAYTSITLGSGQRRVIGAIADVQVADGDEAREEILAGMADPKIKIISLTITEKGYGYDPTTGGLDPSHPGIAADLADPSRPQSAVGVLVAALRRRRQLGGGPVSVLSCDNLPGNGSIARAVVVEFARAANLPDLAAWIEEAVTFPATMVDRITPATTEVDIAQLAHEAGYFDPACVVHERFRQWVIEDNFAAGRPAWEAGGAQFVASVSAHETMKLRCLNGTHSTLAYLGHLAGHETIADAVADPPFAALIERLWREEILPTVPQPEGEDLPAYCRALMARYRDRAIRHRTWQIAMDGSQKLPQRILGTIADALAAGRVPKGLCLAVAGWMRYVSGVDEQGRPIDVRDPLAAQLRAAAGSVEAMLALDAVFPPALAADPRFRDALAAAHRSLAEDGARVAIGRYLG